MSGFQIFAADTTFQNRAARDFFTHPTKKNALSFPDFRQKAWPGGGLTRCQSLEMEDGGTGQTSE